MRFVDTSFWVSLQFRHDVHHDLARQLWIGNTAALVTTNHVLGETWTFLRRRLGHAAALAFVERAWISTRLAIHQVEPAIEQEAWAWLRRHDERAYSFVDATSFATMRQRRLREALAFDGDFTAAGFIEVRP